MSKLLKVSKVEITKKLQNYADLLFNKELSELTKLELSQVLQALVASYGRKTQKETEGKLQDGRKVYYLSMEFLIGRLLVVSMQNLGIQDVVEEVLENLGVSLLDLEEYENDPGLGNGGLGRLAACYNASSAGIGVPFYGAGLFLEKGLFKQEIVDGKQVELADEWLENGNIWAKPKMEDTVTVWFGGYTKVNSKGKYVHAGKIPLKAVPYVIDVVGYGKDAYTLPLYLWKVEETFDFGKFNELGPKEYFRLRGITNSINKVLYPQDITDDQKLIRIMRSISLLLHKHS